MASALVQKHLRPERRRRGATHCDKKESTLGYEPPLPGACHMRYQVSFTCSCQLQSTYKDLSSVNLDLPEGLLVGLGYAATSPDSPLDFKQAQNAAERSEVASPHRWSLMLPTSARVAQEVYEPLKGIQYPMLCSRMGDTSQIGTTATSIREDHLIASGLRFVHWCHASPNVDANNPRNNPTVRVYQHLEDKLTTCVQATIVFQQALLPHPLWLGPLPVCLAEYHQGKVRRLRLVLAALTHLTKAEIASLREGPHLPGGTVVHDLVYGYAVDASPEPEWLVITDGQQPGRWRLLRNSFGPEQRCSVGSSLRYQPTPCTGEQRSAQDYTFEALHRVYFYDAWRVQPVLDGSELVLPRFSARLLLASAKCNT